MFFGDGPLPEPIEIKETKIISKDINKSNMKKIEIFKGTWERGLPNFSKEFKIEQEKFNHFEMFDIFGPNKSLVFHEKGIFFGPTNSNYQFHGKGVCIYHKGYIYRGKFSKGIWNEKGEIFTVHNKKIYKGDIYQGRFGGFGQLYRNDGNICIGHFIEGKMEGTGKILYQNGISFTGNFKQGSKTGKGKLVFQDKSELEGVYKDGKLEGQAILIKEDSQGNPDYFLRKYKNGKLVSQKKRRGRPSLKSACCRSF